jgi:hypothetical protein
MTCMEDGPDRSEDDDRLGYNKGWIGLNLFLFVLSMTFLTTVMVPNLMTGSLEYLKALLMASGVLLLLLIPVMYYLRWYYEKEGTRDR